LLIRRVYRFIRKAPFPFYVYEGRGTFMWIKLNESSKNSVLIKNIYLT
jgi:hypothetical protein